ncbi:tryptophan-associated transmembrane protein [Isoptericola sp. CG 20/1183]|uniref:Tryptophan-associated transmembrane protein n=1 Tax=Isoptericola halotolerans TaxID=300560 RepID=A0ABX5EA67_9MICO|nr:MULTISPECIES: Trp biosynthesis-associated membrane protein [Isoptericola]MCK0115793.1 Trp biosynthesis-associated membrane protein [Isoptericola sp. S6320L]PRZ03448.1 tryptophan-associated transmembrane protein [Isoptericola sp. CG 20/1183]PRZ03735.1 tryptophan-associated transmembrane protein [Isoptericola halotolerans]
MIRSRSRAVVLLLVLGGAAFAVSAPVWLRTTVATALEPEVVVEVPGTTAAPAVSAAAFVVLAGALAATLAGRVARWVALAAVGLAGVTVAVGAAAVLRDVRAPAVSAAADAAGVTTLTSPVEVTPWPWLTVVVGVAVVAAAVLAALGSPSWSGGGTRHERAPTGRDAPTGPVDRDPDAQADWDALSRGTDPSADR